MLHIEILVKWLHSDVHKTVEELLRVARVHILVLLIKQLLLSRVETASWWCWRRPQILVVWIC